MKYKGILQLDPLRELKFKEFQWERQELQRRMEDTDGLDMWLEDYSC